MKHPEPEGLLGIEEGETGARLVRLSEIAPSRVEWLWKGWIPLGKVSILDGDPEHGKTTMTLDWASRVSTGEEFPGEKKGRAPAGVLLVCAEDDPADTLLPRLELMGADLDNIAVIDMPRNGLGDPIPLTFPRDGNIIREACEELGAELIVIDPLMGHASEDINTHNDASTRRMMIPLAHLAQEMGAAVVGIRHFNKDTGASAKNRGGGSVAIGATARSVMAVGEHPDDPSKRVLTRVKNNLHKPVPARVYWLETSPYDEDVVELHWGPEADITAEDLLHSNDSRKEAPMRDLAVDIINSLLDDGPIPAKEALKVLKDNGVKPSTVDAARALLKKQGALAARRIRSGEGVTQAWEWHRPEAGEA